MMINSLATRLTSPVVERRPVIIFCKALSVYIVVKVLLTWSVVSDITAFHRFSQPKAIWSWIVFGPGVWGAAHINGFLVAIVCIAIIALLVQPNYFIAGILAWLSFSFYRLIFPIANGSDQILLTLVFMAVPLSIWPRLESERGSVVQDSVFNTTLLLGKLYVASIYLISGLDKLGSEAWRSGDAFSYIAQLDFIVNPGLASLIPESEEGRLVISWLTILFELSFPVLIWIGRIRLWVCLVGVVFHVVIGVFLSLPDFAGIMMVSYLLFFNDSDYRKLSALFNRKE